MAVGNAASRGFNNSSELFANILNLIGPSAIIIGPNFYIDKTGEFYYDTNININQPTSGAGHLIASSGVAPFTGPPPVFDRFGNSILPEFTTYNNTGGSGSLTSQIVAINLSVGDLAIRTAPQYNVAFNQTFVALQLGSAGLPILNMNGQAATDLIIAAGLLSDADNRFQIDANGLMSWGPGNTLPDVSLDRPNTVGFLRINGALQITNLLQFFSQVAGNNVLELSASGDTNDRLDINNQGVFQWGPGNAATDTVLFRPSAGALAVSSIGWSNAGALETLHSLGGVYNSPFAGAIKYKVLAENFLIFVDINLNCNGVSFGSGSVINPTALPAGRFNATNPRDIPCNLSAPGVGNAYCMVNVSTSGVFTYFGPNVTLTTGQQAFITGQATYSTIT